MKNKFFSKFIDSFSSFFVAVAIICVCVLIAAAVVFPLWLWATSSGESYTVFVVLAVLAFAVWKIVSALRKAQKTERRKLLVSFLRFAVLASGIVAMFWLVISGGRFWGLGALLASLILYAIIPAFFFAEKK